MKYYGGVVMHGEALAYPMALLSIIYSIKTIDSKNNYKLKINTFYTQSFHDDRNSM